MVRPRTGDFLYTAAEFDIILDDIRGFKQAGAHGIVCGVLKADGTIDVSRTEQWVPCTFSVYRIWTKHRAELYQKLLLWKVCHF